MGFEQPMYLSEGWYDVTKDGIHHKAYWHFINHYFTIDTDNEEAKGRYAQKYFDTIKKL